MVVVEEEGAEVVEEGVVVVAVREWKNDDDDSIRYLVHEKDDLTSPAVCLGGGSFVVEEVDAE